MNESEATYSLPIQREIVECGQAAGLCPWCYWKLELRHAGWFLCGNCGKEFYCADTVGTRMEMDGRPWTRWCCFHPRFTPYLPDFSMFKASPRAKDMEMVTARALSPSFVADLRKYWKHGHIILWKRLRMHARRWGLLKD